MSVRKNDLRYFWLIFIIIFSINTSLIGQNTPYGITFLKPKLLKYIPYYFILNNPNSEKLTIEANNAQISKMPNGLYRINIGDKKQRGTDLIVYKQTKAGLEVVLKEFIAANDPPVTVWFLGQESGSEVNLKNISNGGVGATVDNFDVDLKFPIHSFVISVIQNGKVVESGTNGARLTAEQREIIKTLPNGFPLIVTVKITNPDGVLKKLNPVVFYVKK